ncbi:guanine nucleotide-binding protein-like 3 homolog [Biomphalaria glabrata]|uniref:Guanine nucleotide-binding protein-like 3 homolog n=1 Tax=Biomphalaria glabrata TaxID=6526 RepID=A0A9W2Z3W3_BIOGL|nr:guanine nucleotide-binding protein-like 3 homolog [Biomphalaria glabrata]XP_055869747.1 guanine nucleotide-binding protein-like 3 homolog [Biomphalaria glabrata]XP_055869748.1 guanine nucleotide-binding protein-like 3 homolog [Biomphalaria glabrata]XP_055869749.1 guanine nucleotide-binding protein-like 3 homolog [Biomphalaria glabrata]XP_055869750.1 guanine nucleotide-binding protein-like 3 homolog [Biomphalaria glabrata]
MSLKGLIQDLEDIISKQKVLEDLKEKLQVLLDDINQVTKRCTSWIEKTDNITYLELKEYLTHKISEYVQQCFTIALENKNENTEPEIRKVHIKEDYELQSPVTFSSSCEDEKHKILEKEIKNLQRALKSLDTNNKKLTKERQETSTHLNQKRQLVREFMSTLETKIDTLTQETQNSIQSQEEKMEEFSDKIEKCFEEINLLAKQSDDDLDATEIQNDVDECDVDEFDVDELEESNEYLEDHSHKIDYIFDNIDKPLTKYPGVALPPFVMTVPMNHYNCLLCGGETYECWFIKRLKEICKDCWRKELEI